MFTGTNVRVLTDRNVVRRENRSRCHGDDDEVTIIELGQSHLK